MMKKNSILRSVKLCVTYVESCDVEELQYFYLPVEVLHALEADCGHMLKVTYSNRCVLLEAVPQVNYDTSRGLQCIINGSSVFTDSGISSDEDIIMKKFGTINLADVSLLQEAEVTEVNIDILMSSVESTLRYRRCKELYYKSCMDLLHMYKFSNYCTINCRNNALAKLLGISKIVVGKVSVPEDVSSHTMDIICKLCAETSLKIQTVHSVDRNVNLIKKYDELGGVKDILEKIRRLTVEPWKNKELLERLGASYPTGLLLVGPPGCGKTSLVRQICAETGSCLISTAYIDTHNLLAFNQIVEKACKLSEEGPCILFLDEVDSLCPSRSDESSSRQILTTAQVLLIIDRCKEYRSLLLVAATNRPFAVDPALRRSGRFGIEVLLNMPSVDQRKEILAIHLKPEIEINSPVINVLASKTPGFVGADLQSFCEKYKPTLLLLAKDPYNKDVMKEIEDKLNGTVPSFYKTLDFITTTPQVTSLGGIDSVKQELLNIFRHHLELGHLYQLLNLSRPRGVLLVGPRGCGKTRLVASIAHSLGCAFLSANASHLLSPYVGESEKKIASLFYTARLMQPSILFIDEIDGIFGSRSGSAGTVKANLIMEFLQAMDGAYVEASSFQGGSFLSNKYYSTKDEVLVCAATNHPEVLDTALLRPGRFDKVIYVGPPDSEACLEILKLKTAKMIWEREDLLYEVAKHLNGWTGAEIENFVMQVMSVAVLKQRLSQNCIVLTEEDAFQVLRSTNHRGNTCDENRVKAFMNRIKRNL